MASNPRRSLWWNLGAMVGHVVAGAKSNPHAPAPHPPNAQPSPPPAPPPATPQPPQATHAPSGAPAGTHTTPGAHAPHAAPHPQVVAHRVQEIRVQTDTGPVTLRRHTIDEVDPGSPR
jgi:hypothetical protein